MSIIKLPYFDEIDIKKLEEYYEAEIEFEDREVSLDLNFEVEQIDENKLQIVKILLENINDFDSKNRIFIAKDFDNYSNGSIVYDYISFHLKELKEDFSEIIDTKETKSGNLIKLMNSLKLIRIGFYPNEDDETVIFDYCLNDDISNELLVIVLKNQNSLSIAWES